MGYSIELDRGHLGLDPFAVFLKTVKYSGGDRGKGGGSSGGLRRTVRLVYLAT
jgi:hypothetical protein